MYLMSPYQTHLIQNQGYTPESSAGQITQQLIPVIFSGATQTFLPMPLSNPMIPAQEMNNTHDQHGTSPLGQQAMIQSEGLDFFGQLQGSYETDLPEAKKIDIVIVGHGDQRHALVRNTCPDKELPHQIIYEQESRLTLCSIDGYVQAIMLKGSIMRDCVRWYSNDGTWIIWRRVVFNNMMTPSSRRNSMRSVSSSISLDSAALSELSTNALGQLRSDLPPEHSEKEPSNKTSGNLSVCNSPSSLLCKSKMSQRLPNEALLDLFQARCKKHPIVLKKVLNWGISRTLKPRVSEKEILKFCEGRIWVCARLERCAEKRAGYWQRILDEMKGAYLEVTPGVYRQPSQPNEPGAWHRLRKSKRGRWMIEKYNAKRDVWYQCAQERRNGQWIDFNTKRQFYKVVLVPLQSILTRMKESWTDLAEMKRSIEFLFSSCNPKKLNSKLKPRNLKHNMLNLRLKLEKQYSLSFAVRLAETANSIALKEMRCA